MKENDNRKNAAYDELRSNVYLLQQNIKKKNAIIKNQNEEIKSLKKELAKCRILQQKYDLGD